MIDATTKRAGWWRRILALAVLAALAAGCGGSSNSSAPVTSTPATTAAAGQMPVTVYLVRDGKLAAERRLAPRTDAVARAALDALGLGEIRSLVIADGTATVELSPAPTGPEVAQVVYTLTEFPSVTRVALGGKTLSRDDFELTGLVPAILVVSPQPGDAIRSPVRVYGSADTFEATFTIELRDGSGGVVASTVVTATAGSGQRGSFDTSIPFPGAKPGDGTLVAFESSAEDGSRIHVVEIPVTLR